MKRKLESGAGAPCQGSLPATNLGTFAWVDVDNQEKMVGSIPQTYRLQHNHREVAPNKLSATLQKVIVNNVRTVGFSTGVTVAALRRLSVAVFSWPV